MRRQFVRVFLDGLAPRSGPRLAVPAGMRTLVLILLATFVSAPALAKRHRVRAHTAKKVRKGQRPRPLFPADVTPTSARAPTPEPTPMRSMGRGAQADDDEVPGSRSH